jgi:hypothetical protein
MNWMRRSRATLLFSYLRKFAVTITRALTDGTVQQNRNKSMARLVTCTLPTSLLCMRVAQSLNLAEPWPALLFEVEPYVAKRTSRACWSVPPII